MRFGSYGQSIHGTNPTNTTTPKTLGVIYLPALYTLKGGFKVMSLLTGTTISCCNVIKITITQEVIYRTKAMPKEMVLNTC